MVASTPLHTLRHELYTATWAHFADPSVAKSTAASANSMAAVVLQLSTIELASAATLVAGRSVASSTLAQSHAAPWLTSATSTMDDNNCRRATAPPICRTERPSSNALTSVAASAELSERATRRSTTRSRLARRELVASRLRAA